MPTTPASSSTTLPPLKYDGWAADRDGVQKLFLDGATSIRFKVNDDLKVMRRGKIACRKWLIVHEHVSAPLPQ